MLTVIQELRFALRGLRRTPVFTAASLVVLAFASGAVTTVLGVIDSVLLKPLPIVAQDEVVIAWKEDYQAGFAHMPFTPASIEHLKTRLRSASQLATIDYNGAWPLKSLVGDQGTKLPTGVVSGEFFALLGVKPVIGRVFVPADDVPGGHPVVVLGEQWWRSRYAADPNVIGKTISITGIPHEIIGVVPGDWAYPRGALVWTLMRPWPWYPTGEQTVNQDLVARLKPGHTLAEFRAELEAARAGNPFEQRVEFRNNRVVVRRLVDEIIGDLRPTLTLIGIAGLVVLVVAFANIGGLLLVRTGGRIGETAIRAAIGASRAQVLRSVTAEYVILLVSGVGLGLGLAALGVRAAGGLFPIDLARSRSLSLGIAPLAAGAALGLLVGIAAAVIPTVALMRVDLLAALRASRRGEVRGWGTHRLRRVLVTAQIALAITTVVAAGLLVRTLQRLETIDLGLDPNGLMFVELGSRVSTFDTTIAGNRAKVDALIERWQRVPGVRQVAATLQPPFSGNGGYYTKFTTADRGEPANSPFANYEIVTPSYFTTMGMRLMRGRLLEPSDRTGGVSVVVINEALAKILWPGLNPLGRRVAANTEPKDWSTVVGVVSDTRYNDLRTGVPSAYWSARQAEPAPGYYLVRTDGKASTSSIVQELRRAVLEVDPTSVLAAATPMRTLLAAPLAITRVSTMLIGLFGLAALGLAAIGVYGILSSYVIQQTREIGVRLALGADRRAITTMVARRSFSLVAWGLAIGTAGSAFASQAVKRFLYGVTPFDPTTLVGVALVLAGVALIATILPANRASKVDPVVALRAD